MSKNNVNPTEEASTSSLSAVSSALKRSRPMHISITITIKNINKAVELMKERDQIPQTEEDDEEEQEWARPITIVENLSLEKYLKFLEGKHGENLPFLVQFVPQNEEETKAPSEIFGKVIATEFPSDVHEFCAGNIGNQIRDTIPVPGVEITASLGYGRSPRCRIGNHVKEPDLALRPTDLQINPPLVLSNGYGRPFPNLIVEVAFTNESLRRLRGELRLWMRNSTSVQVTIGIKIFGLRVDGTRRMLALLVQRPQYGPNQIVEFGTNPQVPAGLPILSFPLSALYANVAPNLLPASIRALLVANPIPQVTIDLNVVQAEILRNVV